MAPKNLVTGKRRKQKDQKPTQNHADQRKPDQAIDSDPDSNSEAEAAPPPEPVENESACSSPSSSGFLIVPSQKPENKAPTSKVFNHDDVVTMLKGLALFWANGRNTKWAEFHLFIKDRLQNHFTKIQVSEKIRSLKKKFDANLEKARLNGGHLDLPDPREMAVFELSKELWLDEKDIAVKKAQIGENEGEEENSNSTKRRKQMDENDVGSKKMKKRKQLGEENKKTSKPEHENEVEIEELLGGDERDAANTILSMKLVNGNDEGKKKTRKRKHVNERDEKRELVTEGKQEDEDETRELLKEEKQVDGHEEKSELIKEGKQLDDEKRELLKEEKQVEVDERNKKKKKWKQELEFDKENNTVVKKEERVKKKQILKQVHQEDQHDGEEEVLKEVEHINEHEEQDETTRKPKHEDGLEEEKDIDKLEKQVDEENKIPSNHEQEEMDFQSAYPLLYASFSISGCPSVAKEKCAFIGRENALQLEEEWRELEAQMLRLELKKLDLMRDFHRLQGN